MDVGDDFSFGFDTNEDILLATQIEEQTDKSTVIQKLFIADLFTDPWAGRDNPGRSTSDNRRRRARALQDGVDVVDNPDAEQPAEPADIVADPEADSAGNTKKLFNPVMCLQEGDSIFFNVNSDKG